MASRPWRPPVEVHVLDSSYVQQSFRIQIASPTVNPEDRRGLPVVYATDANRSFELFRALSEILQVSGYDLPRFVLVGIGYPSEHPHAGNFLRVRDFTFAGYPTARFDDVSASEGTLRAPPGSPVSHGGEAFSDFIEHELIPFVETRHTVAPGERTYFGHSGGGGFGLGLLFRRPALFARYVISSPNIAFHNDDQQSDFGFDDARCFFKANAALPETRIFISAGTEEQYEPGLEPWRITSNVIRMAAMLRAANTPGLSIDAQIFPGETHMTSWPLAFMRGLKSVLGARAPSNGAL